MRFCFAQWLSFRHSLQRTWIWTNGKKIKQFFYWFVNSYYYKGISFREIAFFLGISSARPELIPDVIASHPFDWQGWFFLASYFFNVCFFFFLLCIFLPMSFLSFSFISISILSICFANCLYFLIFPFHFLSFILNPLCSPVALIPVLHIVSQSFLLICAWLFFFPYFICSFPQTLSFLLHSLLGS